MPKRLVLVALLVSGLWGAAPAAQVARAAAVTSPTAEFGHAFGDDYFLANYRQIEAYWRKLARESNRMVLEDIGQTAEGRSQLMAVVTSPANHKNLARYKEISRRLALAEGLTDDQARALAKEGKTVVWIDGGLHATETLGAQQLGEMVYQMVSRNDAETLRLLDDVIILFVHANPDGNDLVADWYMRASDPTERSTSNLPRLYQKYIGHDNNRDFFASTQPETENMNRVLYHEWFPQILYNHHQSGPAGTILWSPPLRDPFNYNQDPLLVLGLQTVGLALHTRLAAEGKPGATMRSGGPYDGWWNGGIRNTAAFHNTIAILTEMIGNPTPMRVPLVMARQLPSSDLTFPVPPQEWHFRQSIDYSVATNRGVLDIASRMKENFLFNRYVMGKNSITRGSEDSWTARPHRYSAVEREVRGEASAGGRDGGRGGSSAAQDAELWAALHKPEYRDPRGYILPSNQRDFPTAITFINALREVGIKVHRATAAFSVAGKTYPSGSLVVMTNQAFRPHVIDMFEPQDHPDNFPSPGAPPTPPYDNAGWTLAFQMGVEFDRILDGFTGPLEEVADWNLAPPAGHVESSLQGGYLLSRDVLNTFDVVNQLVANNTSGVSVTTGPLSAGGKVFPAGSFHVAEGRRDALEAAVAPLGVVATALGPQSNVLAPFRAPRVGLWDQYGGSMTAGWTRWILEQSNFAFTRVFAPRLDAGNLNAEFDVLIFVSGAIPGAGRVGGAAGGRGGAGRGGRAGGAAPTVPAEYQDQVGSITADVTVPQLKAFVENGGRIVAIGSSASNLAGHLNLPVENHLVEPATDSGVAPEALPRTKYYVPGSILGAHVDTNNPLAFGMQARTDVFFSNSPVWRLTAEAAARGVTPVAWFDSPEPLRSGWAWGQAYLDQGVIAIDAPVGQGRVFLFGPEILMRAQPRGTFKFLFNAVYWGQ
ncbi:MAG: peptidase [Acidobacteria bacterium]|nr:peptidase [Acidobacteriota bacterium]